MVKWIKTVPSKWVLRVQILSRDFKCNFWCEICRKPNYFRSIHVFDRTVKMAREKHLGQTVTHGSCRVSFLHGKTACQKYFFQTLSQKNSKLKNLKNPDLDLIRSILLECGGYFRFMIRVWVLPKKPKIRFWIQESVFGFSHKNAP